MKALHFSIFICLLILVSACSTPPKPSPSSAVKTNQSEMLQPEELISKALSANTPQQQSHFFFLAARAYWENSLFAQSDAALGSVQVELLSESETQQYFKMALTLATQNENTARIDRIMQLIPQHGFPRLNVSQQVEFALLTSKAYEIQGSNIEAAITLIEHRGLFEPESHADLDEKIWQLLRSTQTTELSQFNYSGGNLDAVAWLDLARTIQLNQISLEAQFNALQMWNTLWPEHPASIMPPHELSILQKLPNTRPESITLALPLSGPLEAAGKAVRDGFMANYYANQKLDTAHTSIEIELFDTAKHDILSLYNNTQDGKSLIVGPLDKTSLKALTSLDHISTPTLALNYLPANTSLSSQLYQLGLAPEAEAKQLAQHLHEKNLKRVGVILPENNLGFRIYDTFIEHFSKLDGLIVESVFYKNQASLSSSVAQLLGTAESQARKRKIRNITQAPLEFLPRRRQDIEALVMIAKPEIARQIKPLFAYHYAADLPVFSSSQIHNISNKNNNRDLDGIEFIEMPWMLSNTIDIKTQILNSIPESIEQYTRFYALGADSFSIAPRLKLLQEVQGSQMQGHTGTLSMNAQGVISRKMEWAKFRKGKAIILKE